MEPASLGKQPLLRTSVWLNRSFRRKVHDGSSSAPGRTNLHPSGGSDLGFRYEPESHQCTPHERPETTQVDERRIVIHQAASSHHPSPLRRPSCAEENQYSAYYDRNCLSHF